MRRLLYQFMASLPAGAAPNFLIPHVVAPVQHRTGVINRVFHQVWGRNQWTVWLCHTNENDERKTREPQTGSCRHRRSLPSGARAGLDLIEPDRPRTGRVPAARRAGRSDAAKGHRCDLTREAYRSAAVPEWLHRAPRLAPEIRSGAATPRITAAQGSPPPRFPARPVDPGGKECDPAASSAGGQDVIEHVTEWRQAPDDRGRRG